MKRLRWTTAGESHGKSLVGVLEGMPSGLALDLERVDRELARRQGGYGRGGRIENTPHAHHGKGSTGGKRRGRGSAGGVGGANGDFCIHPSPDLEIAQGGGDDLVFHPRSIDGIGSLVGTGNNLCGPDGTLGPLGS